MTTDSDRGFIERGSFDGTLQGLSDLADAAKVGGYAGLVDSGLGCRKAGCPATPVGGDITPDPRLSYTGDNAIKDLVKSLRRWAEIFYCQSVDLIKERIEEGFSEARLSDLEIDSLHSVTARSEGVCTALARLFQDNGFSTELSDDFIGIYRIKVRW